VKAQPTLLEVKTSQRIYTTKQWKVVSLREVPLRDELKLCTTPEEALAYWREVIETDPRHNADVEGFYVLCLNTRRRVIGFHLVAHGTLDTVLIHPREVFRPAIVANAAAVFLMHNHPSGDPFPSEGDIKVTRDLMRAGQTLKIEVLDHVIVGTPAREGKSHVSLWELGYFFS
jgi:DNA repair protein RadC